MPFSKSRFARYLLLASPLLLAILLYGYTLALPFFMDDGLLFAMIRDYPGGQPGLRFWGGAPSFSYYRPLGFTVWEVNGMLFDGRYDPVGLHLLNVFVYGIGATGLSVLVKRITGKISIGVIAGLLFGLFPFNYNAVMWVASLFHILAVTGIVLALYFALCFIEQKRSMIIKDERTQHAVSLQGSKIYNRSVYFVNNYKNLCLSLILCLISTFIAVFSHENGVLVLPLLAFLLLFNDGWQAIFNRRAWAIGVLIAVIVGGYLYLFAIVPRPGADAQFRPEMAFDNFGILLEGLVYPFAAIFYRVTLTDICMPGLPTDCISPLVLIVMALLMIVPGLFLLWHTSRKLLRVAGYALFWIVIVSLPTALFLETTYIVGSWRLLLILAPGVAIFHAILLYGLWQVPGNYQQIIRGAIVVIVLWTVGISVVFLLRRREEAFIHTEYFRALQTEIDEYAPGDKPLIVNAPSFITTAKENRIFPTVSMGMIFVADFVNYNLLIEGESGEPFPYVDALAYYQIIDAPEWMDYAPFQNYGTVDFTEKVREASDIFATIFENGHFYPMFVGRPALSDTWIFEEEALHDFEEAGVSVLSAEINLYRETLVLETQWQVHTPQAVEPSFSVYCDDRLIGKSTWMVWGNIHPFRVWQPGEIQVDRREIALSEFVNEVCLRVEVTIVDEETNLNSYGTTQIYP